MRHHVLGEGGYVPANERFFAGLRERAVARAASRYAWEPIVDAYEDLFESVVVDPSRR